MGKRRMYAAPVTEQTADKYPEDFARQSNEGSYGREKSLKKEKTPLSRNAKRNIFFACMVFLPLLQFLIFYCIVNLKAVSLAFVEYRVTEGKVGYDTAFAGFKNFRTIIEFFLIPDNFRMITNSVLVTFGQTIVIIPLSLLLAYYLYKKFFMYRFFRTVLFFPMVISSLVMVLLFKYLAENAYPKLTHSATGLLSDPKTRFLTIFIYSTWLGFAGHVVIFNNVMSATNESAVESAKIDGANDFQIFLRVIVPMVYPTITTYVVLALAMLFTNQMNLFTFSGYDVTYNERTVGYYLFLSALNSDVMLVLRPAWNSMENTGWLNFSELSALGIMISIVLVPVVLGVRKLMEKLGPSEE